MLFLYSFLERGGNLSGTYDGKLIYGTKVDTEGFEKGTEDIKKKAKQTSEDVKKYCDIINYPF